MSLLTAPRPAHRPDPVPPPTTRVRGRPRWEWAALAVLLGGTGVLYLADLAASGFGNTFYAAAVQAGSQSWKAWFFGSLDSASFITVDKPPASLWVMGLSARIFGFSSWSLLVPQALMGVASAGLLHGAVRRTSGAVAGLLAGTVLALTPAAALMFRFDNPDALLVLLMTAAGYAVVRALPRASWRWLALAGVLLGFAFLTKMLQGLLVLPAFGLVYLVAAPTSLRRRLVHLLGAGGALVVSAGWWVLTVQLWPADARPYIGGSTDNTVMDLVLGYNGLGRIFGGSGNGGGGAGAGGGSGGAAGSSFGGATGLDRLFGSEMGIEISWLLPAALLALAFGLVARGRAARTDPARAGLLLWGGWLLVTGLVFSFMSGTVHPYYTVALAPAIGGAIGVGGAALWARHDRLASRAGLAALVAAAGGWSFALLARNSAWHPELRWAVLVGAVLSAVGLLVGSLAGLRKLTVVALLVGVLSGLGGTAAYSVATAATAHGGSIPTAGPTGAVTDADTGAGGGSPGGAAPTGAAATGTAPAGGPGGAGGTPLTGGAAPTGTAPAGAAPTGAAPSGATADATAGADGATGGAGSTGGETTSAELTDLLTAATTTWSAATDGSQSAATLELASGTAVVAIGGWSSDPTPTLAEFQALVAGHEVSYYVAGGQGGGAGGPGGSTGGTATAISEWVSSTFTATTVGSSTVYDLTGYTG